MIFVSPESGYIWGDPAIQEQAGLANEDGCSVRLVSCGTEASGSLNLAACDGVEANKEELEASETALSAGHGWCCARRLRLSVFVTPATCVAI